MYAICKENSKSDLTKRTDFTASGYIKCLNIDENKKSILALRNSGKNER